MKFRPISNKIIAKKLEKEALSSGGIVIPDTLRDSYNKNEAAVAEVLAVGPGLDEHRHLGSAAMEVQVGDKVAYISNTGMSFKFKGEEFLSIPEKFILAVFSV